MSFRVSAVLLVILVALGSYAYSLPPADPPKRVEGPQHIWDVAMDDIVHIDLAHQGKVVSFDWDNDKSEWYFLPDSIFQGKVIQDRAMGIRVLLGGPGHKRELFREQPQDLAQYGLNPPSITANLSLRDGTKYRVLIGDTTANGQSNYIMLDNRPQVWLVDVTWGEQMVRMFKEPPVAPNEG